MRGFTREILGLASWIVALAASLILAPYTVHYLEGRISVPSLRIAASYALVFVAFLVLGAIVTAIVSSLVRKSPLSGVDRMIGGGFGALRGVLMGVLMVWLVGMTPARQDPWWTQSLFVGRLQWLADGFNHLMPADWASRIKPTAVSKEGV
jgi:membrane protein required for colicin V production